MKNKKKDQKKLKSALIENKKTIIFVLVVVIVFLIVLILTSDKKQDITLVKGDTEDSIKLLLDKNTSIKDITKKTGIKMTDYNVIVGEDSYLFSALEKEEMDKNNLSKYETAQIKYAKEIENRYLESVEYTLGETIKIDDYEAIQKVKLKSYYYELYLTDLMELTSEILKIGNYDINKTEDSEKVRVAHYKAKVKAMQIMSNYKESYDNKKEITEFEVVYRSNEPKNSDEMLTLLLNMKGMTYENMDFTKKENVTAQKNRIKKYITEAKLTKENLFEL